MSEQSSPRRQLTNGELPEMVRWYDPRLLIRVGIRTAISSIFGEYSDQRLIQAATDPADEATLVGRYDYSDLGARDPAQRIDADAEGGVWVDYIADIGDGFIPTYTMAYLLAQPGLQLEGAGYLPAGGMLVLGGDQCYPQGTREEYKRRFQTPFEWAFDVPAPQRKLFAIPGNHDWYDGLNAFDSLFCSSRDRLSDGHGTVVGGWQCQQHRSYFAIKLPYDWWIWGTDIQFSKYLDISQVNYFQAVAKRMGPGDKLVLMMSEPTWLLADLEGIDEEENFFRITRIARERGVKICAVIAGDWHHYNRYFAQDIDVHFFTAGGGGAFLHPTHILRENIKVNWPEKSVFPDPNPQSIGASGEAWSTHKVDIRLKEKKDQQAASPVAEAGEVVEEVLAPIEDIVTTTEAPRKKRQAIKPRAPKCYPDRVTSWHLSLRNLLFPFFNLSFGFGIGVIYWLVTWQFHTVTQQFGISKGDIDLIGVPGSQVTFFSLAAYMPLYIVQATRSVAFVAMLAALYFFLVNYVHATSRKGLWRSFVKVSIGTVHFLTHLIAMFTLFLLFISFHNSVSPALETWLKKVFEKSDRIQIEQTSEAPGQLRGIIREALEPLGNRTYEYEQPELSGSDPALPTTRSAVPPEMTGPLPKLKPIVEVKTEVDSRKVREFVGLLYPFEMVLLGGIIGGFIWGCYWVLTGLLGRMHSEDAFAALRIKRYKNFLRMRFDKDKLTIYPIGVDRPPGKNGWLNRPTDAHMYPSNARLVPAKPIEARLIEEPIVIWG